MDITTFNTLLSEIRNGDEDTASKLLKGYGDKRAQAAIDESWKRSRKLLEYAMHNREKRVKNEILDYEDEQSVITIIGLTRYVASIEDCLRKHSENASEETRDALADVADLMYNKLGSIKIDKRIVFSKSE